MEKSNNLSNDLKHHTIYSKRPMNLKDSWDDHYNDQNDHNFLSGFSWPPRSYTCTFCKREFRSAQALGGHMNVHRRDRARLRQSPPRDHAQFYPGNNLLNLNLDPNPNPNFIPNPNPNFSSSSPQPSSPQRIFKNPPFTSKLPPLLSHSLPSLSSPSSVVSRSETLEWGSMDHVGAPTHNVCSRGTNSGKMKSQKTLFNGVSHDRVAKKGEIVGLNLEIGLVSESKVDELDLELRLGYL